jgi:hypothetical protein
MGFMQWLGHHIGWLQGESGQEVDIEVELGEVSG